MFFFGRRIGFQKSGLGGVIVRFNRRQVTIRREPKLFSEREGTVKTWRCFGLWFFIREVQYA